MHVIGTAGHVDHGKSTLVEALTGIDPDRLEEEKQRGMTIDLGFAWMTLPGGEEVSIVDVPGHERFIKNMLAGVGGIDLALLVVAADEGVMPQTCEHVAILELLRVRRAVVALTKVDAVEADWLELVRSDVDELLSRTELADAPIVPVSALARQGLPELVATLARRLADTPMRPDLGRPRLPVDRVFTIAGFGTVVTGTLGGGWVRVGQDLELQPSGLRARVRGLQTHRHRVEAAPPGGRVAVNLVGVSTDQIARGDVLTVPGWLRPTGSIDAHVRVAADAPHPLRHNATLSLHTAAAEAAARVLLLDGRDELRPGESGWAQARLARPLAVAKGDLFILRTPNATIGGGEIVDPTPRRHRRRDPAAIAALETARRGSPAEQVVQALDAAGPLDAGLLSRRTGLSPDVLAATLEEALVAGAIERLGDRVVSPLGWRRVVEEASATLAAYHHQHPLRAGMPREELKSRLGLGTRLFNQAVARLAAEGIVAEADARVRAADHLVALTPAQEEAARRLREALLAEPFAPPSASELRAHLGLDEELLRALADRGDVVLLTDDVIVGRDAYERMVARVVDALREGGTLTVAAARDLLGSSRKYVLALLEDLDRRHLTRRVGDERRLWRTE